MAVTIDALQKQIANKNEEIAKLKEKLRHFTESPYYSAYETIYVEIESQLKNIRGTGCDINNPDNKDVSEMRRKFLNDSFGLFAELEKLREKMRPDEQRLLDKMRDDGFVESKIEQWRRN